MWTTQNFTAGLNLCQVLKNSMRQSRQKQKCGKTYCWLLEDAFWCILDYERCEGEWTPRELVDWELMIPVDNGSQKPILNLSPYDSRKPWAWKTAQLEEAPRNLRQPRLR